MSTIKEEFKRELKETREKVKKYKDSAGKDFNALKDEVAGMENDWAYLVKQPGWWIAPGLLLLFLAVVIGAILL